MITIAIIITVIIILMVIGFVSKNSSDHKELERQVILAKNPIKFYVNDKIYVVKDYTDDGKILYDTIGCVTDIERPESKYDCNKYKVSFDDGLTSHEFKEYQLIAAPPQPKPVTRKRK